MIRSQTTARARKAHAIAQYLELEARKRSGFDPAVRLHWDLLISHLGWAPQKEWRAIAAAAGQRYPSVRTQCDILDLLRAWRDAASDLSERSAENPSVGAHLSISFTDPLHSVRA